MSELLKNIQLNQRVGHIIAIDKTRAHGKTMLTCLCDCGNTFTTYPDAFRLKKITRCHSCVRNKVKTRKPRLDLTHKIFGNLTVVGLDIQFTGRGSSWLCQCSCGGPIKSILSTYLVNKKVTHCGCIPQRYDNRNYKTLSISHAYDYAISKNGACLSTEYKGANSPLKWMCHKGHKWSAKLGSMRSLDTWCPKCANENNRVWSMHDAINKAKENEGSFLSNSFTNRGSIYNWSCKNGHQFNMEFDGVLKGRWCPKCKYKTEHKVRSIVERLTNKSFPQKSPLWLINPKTGGRMKFDCYNEELKLAIEYHGVFHYKTNPWGTDINHIKYRDKVKKALARKHGVRLITIPHTVKNIESFLQKRI